MTDKIKWHFAERTLFSDRQARLLEKGILDACQVDADDTNLLSTFVCILTITERVEFPSDKARPSLKDLPAFLAGWPDMSPAAVWEYFNKRVARMVWVDWASAFTREQSLFLADPAELPFDVLTEEQRVEAADPNSPLA